MRYNIEVSREFKDNIIINYGIIEGNNIVVFIKVGQDGTIYGYENKYLEIAHGLNKKYGYTVICSSNPFNGDNPLDVDFKVIEDYFEKRNIINYEIYYMGHSNGARIGMTWGYKYPKIKKMLLVNAPLFINWYKLKEGLSKINYKEVYLVYGELDQSYKYTELLKTLLNDNIKLEIISGVDHHFTGMLDEFVKLPEKFLISK